MWTNNSHSRQNKIRLKKKDVHSAEWLQRKKGNHFNGKRGLIWGKPGMTSWILIRGKERKRQSNHWGAPAGISP